MKKIDMMRTMVWAVLAFSILLFSACEKDEDPVNNLPKVSMVTVSPSSITPSGVATVSVTATDDDNDELTYTYAVSGGTINGTGSSATWNAPSIAGVYTVNVTVSDGKGDATGSAVLTVQAPVNNNPVINSVQVNPSSANPGASVSVSVDASDADGDALTYSYQVTGGAVSGNGSSVSWTAPSQAGAYSVTVTVDDGNGGSTSSSGSLTVNQLVTQITGTASFPAGTSGDLQNAKVSIYTSYDNWNNNNPLMFVAATGSGSNVSFTITDIPPGLYYLDVWKDNDNSSSWSTGDFVGWYGAGGLGAPSLTEISLTEGQTKDVEISMMTIGFFNSESKTKSSLEN